MIHIDFLPASYRDRKAGRTLKLWRICVVTLIGSIVAAAAGYQQYLLVQVDRQLAELQPQRDRAAATMAQLGQLSDQLKSLGHRADLYTYLRHPWPRTQVLAAVVEPLPESVKFDEVRMVREALPVDPATLLASAAPADGAAAADPAIRDLERLRASYDRTRLIINITGTTENVVELHRYLGEIGQSRVFQRAKLRSIEAIGDDPQLGSRFSAELYVRPGYGQPNGPATNPELLAEEQQLAAQQRTSATAR